ncbi:hypothetical protein [Streptomyces sp. NPDC018045]
MKRRDILRGALATGLAGPGLAALLTSARQGDLVEVTDGAGVLAVFRGV